MTDEGVVTKYRYDELDRLLETVSDSKAISYEYDKRGNISKEYTDGLLKKTFTFDATNMLSKVVDSTSGEATYSYNGMGKRVAVQNPTESIDYLLDLTKDYHNMLERTVNGESEIYTYDSNVVSMSKSGNDYFYMLDELGTGMYLTGTDGIATSTYAYDEFGRNINPFTGKKETPAYTKQGNIIQPLAFTGYQHDEMTGSYFAQARYYDAGAGRFVSEDKVRGFIDSPESINHYLYCLDNPVKHIDMDGNCPMLIGAGIGALAGGIIGGGATIASSLIKGEDVNWKEVGKNAAIGAASGAVIGSGVGLVSAAAGAAGASATVTTGIAIGGGTVSTAMATNEAVSQIQNDEKINMLNVSKEGFRGAMVGMVGGAALAYNTGGAVAGGLIQSISDLASGRLSSVEEYAGAMFAGSIVPEVNIKGLADANIMKKLLSTGFLGGASSVFVGESLENITGNNKHTATAIIFHTAFAGVVSGILSPVIGHCLPYDTSFLTGKNYDDIVYKIIEEYGNHAAEQIYQELTCGEK